MPRHPIARPLVLPVLALVLSSCRGPSSEGPAAPAPLGPADATQVRAVNQAYADAWVRGEPAAVMALFTDDAVLIPHHGDPPVEGKDAIRTHFWPPGAPPFTVTDYAMTPDEVGGDGDLAYVRGRMALSLAWDDAGRTYANAGNYVMLFRRDVDGAWRIARYIWNDPVPQ